jgi:uncharacterized protein (DUF2236 family)
VIAATTARARRVITGEIASLLGGAGSPAVARSVDGLFGPRSVAWRVNGDVMSMLTGGVAALLLQMLHPGVLAGVWDHSRFRDDMAGRLQRTARFVALTTYGTRAQAEAAIATVRAIHGRIGGTLPDGTRYAADDPVLLGWVHVSGATSFLAGWRRYAEPYMSGSDQDRYLAEMADVARALGVDRPPCSRRDAEALIRDCRHALRVDERVRDVAALVLRPASEAGPRAGLSRIVALAGVDLLPGWAGAMHGRSLTLAEKAAVRAGARGIAGVVRWALS